VTATVTVTLTAAGASLLAVAARVHRLDQDREALTRALEALAGRAVVAAAPPPAQKAPGPLLERRGGRWAIHGALVLGRAPVGLELLHAALRGPVAIGELVRGKHAAQVARRQIRDAKAWASRRRHDELAEALGKLTIVGDMLTVRQPIRA
jgi:anti-sigma factor RsiW